MKKALISFGLAALAVGCVVREGPASPHSAPPPPPPPAHAHHHDGQGHTHHTPAATPAATNPTSTTPTGHSPASPAAENPADPRRTTPTATKPAVRPTPTAPGSKPGSSVTTAPPPSEPPKEEDKKKGTYTEVYDANGNPIPPPASREGAKKQPEDAAPNTPKIKKVVPQR